VKAHPVLDPWALISASVESVLVTDTDLDSPGPVVVFVNPAFERMSGWSESEIVGQSPRILQGPDTDLSAFSGLKERLRKGQVWEGQAINYRKNGSKFVMEWSIAPVLNADGEVTHFVAVQRDITSRVEAERDLRDTREAVITSLEQQKAIREIFGRFVPKEIADRALADSGSLQPDLREATILFTDIEGFSTLAETMSPRAVIELLNDYFGVLTKTIEAHNGVIHQFQGDGVLAAFNLPLKNPEHASNAVAAAIEIREILASHKFAGDIFLKTRFGINTGTVVAGTVGGAERIGYTVHGDAVNLTARIEQENKNFGTDILIAEQTILQIGKAMPFRSVETITVRGRRNPVTLYTI
jgi:PAS domain S-box-containing protein